MYTELSIGKILSDSIMDNVVKYKRIRNLIVIDGLEDEDLVMIDFFYQNYSNDGVTMKMFLTSNKLDKKIEFNGKLAENAEAILRATDTEYVNIYNSLIEIDDFMFETLVEDDVAEIENF